MKANQIRRAVKRHSQMGNNNNNRRSSSRNNGNG
ncbi:23S rRNA pseudouridylate synthase, partial [Escherichia coli]|nr:23S rRNA pseudouridylate synthase [Escherichia coli]